MIHERCSEEGRKETTVYLCTSSLITALDNKYNKSRRDKVKVHIENVFSSFPSEVQRSGIITFTGAFS